VDGVPPVIERQATWGEVTKGMYVRDRNQKAWRVEDQRSGQLLLIRPDEKTVIPRPSRDTAVTVLDPTDAEALAVLERELGASVVAKKDSADRRGWICPPLTRDLEGIHSHMFLMHGLYTRSGAGSRNAAKLLDMHRTEHTGPDGPTSHAYQKHEHHQGAQ
jgi:hypothetical protein